MRFLDTNILLRFLTGDDPAKAAASADLLVRADAGEEELLTSETVIAEVFYVLTRGRSGYQVERVELAERMKPVIVARSLRLPDKASVLRALDVYETYPALDFEDALSVAHMESSGISEIVSYDRGFDRVEGVVRVEP